MNKSRQYLSNEMPFDGSGYHFQTKKPHPDLKVYTNLAQVLITSDRVARFFILTAYQIGQINTFVTVLIMVPEAIFIVKFNTRPKKKYENYTFILITSDRVARFSILIAHYIHLTKTFVTRCYLMVSEAIFIVKSNIRLQKSMKITLKYSKLLIGLPDCQY